MLELFSMITKYASSGANVLVTGESGTGKELIAKAVYNLSPRKTGRFVTLNCAAIPEGLLESELFGYMKGAFSGAVSNKEGLFELADEGTIFLDEIAEMPITLQASQEGRPRRSTSLRLRPKIRKWRWASTRPAVMSRPGRS
jgi:two-component system response regulator PilR (NtrC family)